MSWLWIFLYFVLSFERTKEHVTRANSAIKGRLDNCLNVEHLFFINNLILNDVNTHEFRLNPVRQNTRIIDESNNWNILLFKEAYHIKEECPILNNGVKVSREMQLFWMQFTYNVYTNNSEFLNWNFIYALMMI